MQTPDPILKAKSENPFTPDPPSPSPSPPPLPPRQTPAQSLASKTLERRGAKKFKTGAKNVKTITAVLKAIKELSTEKIFKKLEQERSDKCIIVYTKNHANCKKLLDTTDEDVYKLLIKMPDNETYYYVCYQPSVKEGLYAQSKNAPPYIENTINDQIKNPKGLRDGELGVKVFSRYPIGVNERIVNQKIKIEKEGKVEFINLDETMVGKRKSKKGKKAARKASKKAGKKGRKGSKKGKRGKKASKHRRRA